MHCDRTYLQYDPNSCAKECNRPCNEEEEGDPDDRKENVLGHGWFFDNEMEQENVSNERSCEMGREAGTELEGELYLAVIGEMCRKMREYNIHR